MNIAKLHAEGRQFRTVQGKRPVRILCTDRAHEYPVVYTELLNGGEEVVRVCDNEGHWSIEPIPIEREGWVVLNDNNTAQLTVWVDRDAAWEHAHGKRLARITWQE